MKFQNEAIVANTCCNSTMNIFLLLKQTNPFSAVNGHVNGEEDTKSLHPEETLERRGSSLSLSNRFSSMMKTDSYKKKKKVGSKYDKCKCYDLFCMSSLIWPYLGVHNRGTCNII